MLRSATRQIIADARPRVLAAWASGHSPGDIPDLIGVSRAAVRCALSGARSPDWTAAYMARMDVAKRAYTMRLTGMDIHDIATALGIDDDAAVCAISRGRLAT